MKYIDADKLRAEIDAFYTKYKAKFHQNGDSYHLGIIDGLDMAERILDTLEEPEQPTMGYDEAYLNEKIAKASKSWEGVDVDKFMDEVRGREPVTDCHDLTEAAIDFADYARKALYSKDYAISSIADYDHGCIDGFKAGAEWQKKQIPMPEDTVIFQKGVEEGKRLMMEDAVEGEVVKDISNKLAVTAKNINLDGLKFGDKVRIIVLPKED